jgi:transposase
MSEPSLAERRIAVRTLWSTGVRDAAKISEMTGLPLSTAYRYVAQLRAGEKLEPLPRSGRPRVLTPRKRQYLGRLIAKDKFSTVKDLTNSLQTAFSNLTISRWSVNRAINRLGYHSQLPQRVPILTADHKKARVAWAKAHVHENWNKVVWTDETSFQMFSNTMRAFHKDDEAPLEKPIPKHPYKIHFWGAFSASGTIDYYMFTQNLNGELYRTILTNNLFPNARRKMRKDWVLQQDNDPIHRAHETLALLDQCCPQLLDWPSNSPDLNPIENLWALMKRRVERKVNALVLAQKPVTVYAFEDIIQKEWENITPNLCLNLVRSMAARIGKVIAAKGKRIRY